MYTNLKILTNKKRTRLKQSLLRLTVLVYDLGTLKLRFVAPMPEHSGTPTMHFPEVSQGTYQRFSSPKLRKLDQTDVFQYRMLYQWGKK